MDGKIEDRYTCRILRTVAEGGMGAVYEAVQEGAYGFEKRVAIKTLLPSLSGKREFLRMLIAEGKLVANLVHENIVQIYNLAESELGCHIVMEYVHGISLSDFIHYHGALKVALPEKLAVFIAARIARGLAYAHSRCDRGGNPLGIVHRDICPRNILITAEGLPKIADFGIAKAVGSVFPGGPRSVMGKLHYMSPEQARGDPVDFRSDIYSLGLVLFELMSLRHARHAGGDRTQLLQLATHGGVDWDRFPDDVTPDIRRILTRMLAADPADRYGDTDILGYELDYHLHHEGLGPTAATLGEYLRVHFPYLSATPEALPDDGEHTRILVSTVFSSLGPTGIEEMTGLSPTREVTREAGTSRSPIAP